MEATPDTHKTLLTVNRMYKEGGIQVGEEHDETPIELRVPTREVPMAKVGASSRMTLNMGNYESVQLEVTVELPAYVEELGPAYETAKKFVDDHLNKEVKAIREYRAAKSSTGA